MKFMLLMPPTVPGTLEDCRRLRPIGRNNERYQQMLDELRKLVVFATTEHHFRSEERCAVLAAVKTASRPPPAVACGQS